ncbi:hypothetical protein F4561_003676 [Lipingzhangella halophila]|uniref:Uncharacterized protein n=1 Tax=Lipingzhangella halophila TaxID=1783352 RepID=A0A7W7RIZ8_9ACTN|nr:hypothetical protein [Lipingzhangella halophila]MBB4932856.1 hypothetical protein [Lipingzhangella halophila]
MRLSRHEPRIGELTATLGGLDEAIAHLQITRTTLLSLAGRCAACDLCQALGLPIVSKNVENIRSTLKHLVSHGILTETESGLFTQPHP